MNSPNVWNHSNGDKRGLYRSGGASALHDVGDGVKQLKSEGVSTTTFSNDARTVSFGEC